MTAGKNPVADAPSSTSLLTRLVEAPHLPAPEAAGLRLREWLTGVDARPAATIAALLDEPLAKRLLLGIIEFSPYLFDLVRADADRLVRLLQSDPDVHLASLIEAAVLAIRAASDEADVARALRRMKSE